MYKDILRTITGIEVFPMISLLLFVTIFAIVLVWTALLDAARLSRLASLPLDGTEGDGPAGTPASAHSRSGQ